MADYKKDAMTTMEDAMHAKLLWDLDKSGLLPSPGLLTSMTKPLSQAIMERKFRHESLITAAQGIAHARGDKVPFASVIPYSADNVPAAVEYLQGILSRHMQVQTNLAAPNVVDNGQTAAMNSILQSFGKPELEGTFEQNTARMNADPVAYKTYVEQRVADQRSTGQTFTDMVSSSRQGRSVER